MELETYIHPHILGGLYGQALGDAWAMPAFFRPYQTWSYYDGWIHELLPAPPDHPLYAGFQAGQVTDNTHQAVALTQMMIAEGEVTVTNVARAITTWYDQFEEDKFPFLDPGTRQAVAAIKAGADPQHSGLYGDTAGAAAWISPLGLIYPANPEAAVQDAILACTPTHFTDVAVSGACAVVAAVAQALSPDTTLEDIVAAGIEGAEAGLRHAPIWFGASVARKIDYAVQLATQNDLSERDRLQNLYDLVGSTRHAADAVPCAFGLVAMANGNPIETAIFAAALSGLAPTIGAMACAIAGTWYGIEAIPPEFIQILRQANPQYNWEEMAEELYEIACKNYHLAPPQTDQPGLDSLLHDISQDESGLDNN